MNLKYTKHYYDPFEKLDHKWQEAIVTGNLTVSQVAKLSGFSRQHIYNLISNGTLTAKMLDGKFFIPCKAFVRWWKSYSFFSFDGIFQSKKYDLNVVFRP